MTRGTSVYVHIEFADVLHEIPIEDLVEELKRRKADRLAMLPVERYRQNELDEAADYLRRGSIQECLIHIERALPREFLGIADKLEVRRA